MSDESPAMFSPPQVWREAQNVIAALVDKFHNDAPDADEFLLRDTLTGQYYVTAALYSILVRLLNDLSDPEEYLKWLGLLVAQKLTPPSGFKDTPASA